MAFRSTVYDKARGDTSGFRYKRYGGALRPDAISGLDPGFYDALSKLYAAAPPEVQAELGITSGYRSEDVQRKLWEASDKTGRMVAAPGKSKHQSGTAADLYGFGLKGQPSVSQATRDWVTKNVAQHNLYFPMSYEPWHIQMAEQQAVAMKQAGYSDEQIKQAFLTTVAGTEAPGYDVLYGGGKFTDYSRHPNQAIPITSGPNAGKTSSAAGRYQFITPTWESAQKALGLKDFSPESQDAAAWWLAETEFKKLTNGGSLMEALQSNDPGRVNAAAQILNKQWTSLPGGAEQSKQYGGTGTFYDVYNKALGGTTAPVDVDEDTTVAAPKYEPPKNDRLAALAKGMGAGMGGAGGGGAMQFPQMPEQVGAARVDQPAVATIDPQQTEYRRQMLAQVLARLNQGSLV